MKFWSDVQDLSFAQFASCKERQRVNSVFKNVYIADFVEHVLYSDS